MELKKRGLFFTWDALIALIIILTAVLLLYSSLKTPHKEKRIEQDILVSLSNLPIGKLNDSYVMALVQDSGVDSNKSVLEALGILNIENQTKARLIASEILAQINTSANLGIWYGSTLIASKNSTTLENAENVYVARQFISGIKEGESVTGFSSRAYLYNNFKNKYFYFGGYIGDGNITVPIEYYGNLTNVKVEMAISNNFTLYINSNFTGLFNSSISDKTPISYELPTGYFSEGNNTLLFKGANLYITGGYIRISYNSPSIDYDTNENKKLPGIEGLINIYDGLDIPGSLNWMEMSIHFNSSYETFVTLGNTSVYNGTSDGVFPILLADSNLSSLLNYTKISNKTIPLRIGIKELTRGYGRNADVILITDLSGSMAWRMDADNVNGATRSCSDSALNSSSTSRVSLAKCIDMDFVSTVLSGSGNRIGLVSFSTNANSFVNLTTNKTLINKTILAYSPSGSTCISCAINRAYKILNEQSAPNRKKFIITMTDGVANIRSTQDCNDLYGAGTSSKTFLAGLGGLLLTNASSEWQNISSSSTSDIYSIAILNSTGFGVGSSGAIISWNGSAWKNDSSPVASSLYGVSIANESFALAVGSSGRVLKWNGTGWGLLSTTSSSATLYAVHSYNATFAFAAGVRSSQGRVYKTVNGGASWTEDYSGGDTLRGIKVINSTKAYAVGLNGRILQWNGASWSVVSSPTSQDIYSLEVYNSTLLFAVGGDNGQSIILSETNGNWNVAYTSSAGDSLRAIAVSNKTAYAAGDGGTILEYNGTWARNWKVPVAYEGIETTGVSCSADAYSCTEPNSFPALNANYSSCMAHQNLINSTIHSIGFGPVASCEFGSQVLESIAECGNGTFFSSSDAATLQSFYAGLAASIVNLSYHEQTSYAIGNLSSTLYPDSYIKINYSRASSQFGSILSLENTFDNESGSLFQIPASARVLQTHIVSYSGPKWTSLIEINNDTIYNLSEYGSEFDSLGDPYSIFSPSEFIKENNSVSLLTATSATNQSEGSQYNKIISLISKQFTSYSPISSRAQGCSWIIQFEDNSQQTIKIPSNYTGTNICVYNSSVPYDENDAIQASAYNLLRMLDLNNNLKVDIKFMDQDLGVSSSEMIGIPYTWSTEVQVRTWD